MITGCSCAEALKSKKEEKPDMADTVVISGFFVIFGFPAFSV
jgi:hypothetical protein